MAGIIFLRTKDLPGIVDFYTREVGMEVWLEQTECTVLKHGNLLLGFCRGEVAETEGCYTIYTPDRQGVDRYYERLKDRAVAPPKVTEQYRIYNFFARDPEDRVVEFQAFLHPVVQLPGGDDLLATRRSVRDYRPDPVPDAALDRIFESCRYVPTSNHSQSYTFVVVRDRAALDAMTAMRGGASAPIGRAPCAVVVCSDTAKSGGSVNGYIAAYHLLLAAWAEGLGTCWIGAMDRDDVKELLHIPPGQMVACVTPLGYPAEESAARDRRPAKELFRVVE